MKIAIIGAGLSGLAVAAFLLKTKSDCSITFFDPGGVGGGASGVASGLLHPYPGEKAKRSLYADQALSCSLELLKFSQQYHEEDIFQKGILRFAMNEEQKWIFLQHQKLFKDIVSYEGDLATPFQVFLLQNGYHIQMPLYLEGLWKFCKKRGAMIVPKRILFTEELDSFDRIIIAAGYGVKQLKESSLFALKFIKGQLLHARLPRENLLSLSMIGKGYIGREGISKIHLGSTYEHRFHSEEPCIQTALEIILPRIASFFPPARECFIDSCSAAVRVANKEHYFPIAKRLDQKKWIITAMGSRGLLYHGLLGKKIASEILNSFSEA